MTSVPASQWLGMCPEITSRGGLKGCPTTAPLLFTRTCCNVKDYEWQMKRRIRSLRILRDLQNSQAVACCSNSGLLTCNMAEPSQTLAGDWHGKCFHQDFPHKLHYLFICSGEKLCGSITVHRALGRWFIRTSTFLCVKHKTWNRWCPRTDG